MQAFVTLVGIGIVGKNYPSDKKVEIARNLSPSEIPVYRKL